MLSSRVGAQRIQREWQAGKPCGKVGQAMAVPGTARGLSVVDGQLAVISEEACRVGSIWMETPVKHGSYAHTIKQNYTIQTWYNWLAYASIA